MKTNLDKLFKTSEALEKNGVWFNLTDETGFLLKPLNRNNPNIKSALARYYKPYAYQIEKGTFPPEKEFEINIQLFLEASMVDWKGVEIDGKDTPYSKEVALQFFKELPDLFDELFKHVQDFKNYQSDLGNS